VIRAFVILSNNGEFSSDRLMSVLNLQWAVLRPVVLHNFIREKDGLKFEDAMTVTGLKDVPDGRSANNVRYKVADYFLTDAGALPWQMSKIRTVEYTKT